MNKQNATPSLAIALLLSAVLVGCATFYATVVTITSVVDVTMKNWAELSVAGKTTPAIDIKVKAAYAKYQAACGVAAESLKTYKSTGDQTSYNQAVAVAKTAATELLAILTPLLTSTVADDLSTKLAKAKTL
jgi:hypothetical protein